MVNPWAGEVELTLDGVAHGARLTLGALVELENRLGLGSLVDLAARFESGCFSGRDVLAVLVAGLRGGGWKGQETDLLSVQIAGSPVVAAQKAAELLVRAFALPGEGG